MGTVDYWFQCVLWVCCIVAVVVMSGCSGELYVGTRRIDEVTQTQKMIDKPWYCAYVNCGAEK